jgi:hypothetical protein
MSIRLVSAFLLAAGLSGPARVARPVFAASDPATHGLVERTLQGLSAGRDIETVSTIDVNAQEVVRDLVENDHPMTPPFPLPPISTLERIAAAWPGRFDPVPRVRD